MDCTTEEQTMAQDRLLDLEIFEKQESINMPYHYRDRREFFPILNTSKNTLNMAKAIKKDFKDFSKENLIDLHREINIRSKLLYPTIIKFIGYSLTDFEKSNRAIIITEYVSKVTLNNILLKDNDKLNLTETQKLINIYGIAAGMFYLHSHDIILRNLQLESIFIDEHFYPKITEFNSSKEISSNSTFSEPRTDTTIKSFSSKNLAPEILKYVKYSKSSDVYDFGNLCYSIIMNEEPKENKITFQSNVPEAYQNLIKRCRSKDPENRPSFSEILQDLKNDSNFITDSIDKDEFNNYIKSIEESQIEFYNEINNQKLDDKINEFMHTFHRNGANIKLRGPLNSDVLINLNNFIITDSRDKNLLYKTFEVCENESGLTFCGRSYLKEIMTFSKHEIINFCRELNIISKLNHPSILKMIGYSPVNFDNDQYPTIINEFSLWRNLNNIISVFENDSLNDDTNKLIIIYGIASGMAYLHSHDIIHRDLKPSNINIDEDYLPKITGFNISKEIKSEEDKKSDNIKGTPIYLAPEIYQNKEYSKSSDVYSYSLILYEIFTKQRPYSECTSSQEIKEKVTSGQRPEFDGFLPMIYRQLIERCWSQNPTDRPTFEEIVHELRTNPEFITDSTDKEDYFEYIRFIDEFDTTYEPSRQIKELNDILSTKINTFKEIQPSLDIRKMNETETNCLIFNCHFIDCTKYSKSYGRKKEKGYFYTFKIVKKGQKEFAKKKFSSNSKKIFKNGIINFRREMNIIPQLNHPSILKFIGYNPIGSKGSKTPAIITEYAYENDLARIIDVDDSLNNTEILIIIYGVAAGMAYLHSHDIIHRDLKPENIFLNKRYHPKITGFNISKEIKSEEDKKK